MHEGAKKFIFFRSQQSNHVASYDIFSQRVPQPCTLRHSTQKHAYYIYFSSHPFLVPSPITLQEHNHPLACYRYLYFFYIYFFYSIFQHKSKSKFTINKCLFIIIISSFVLNSSRGRNGQYQNLGEKDQTIGYLRLNESFMMGFWSYCG